MTAMGGKELESQPDHCGRAVCKPQEGEWQNTCEESRVQFVVLLIRRVDNIVESRILYEEE